MELNDIDDQTKTFLLEKYIRQAVEQVKHKGRGNEIKVNCPFCDDHEMKGTLWLTNTYRWCYTCWRASCQCEGHGILATKWLKEVSPGLYEAYVDELKELRHRDDKKKSELQVIIEKKKAEDAKKQKEDLDKAMAKDRSAAKYFKKISVAGKYQKAAIEFCKNRMIPEEIWSKFYYADEGKYAGRVIIPFYTKENKIRFFQGRALDPENKVKYLSRVGSTALYNIDFVDKGKPLVVLEGPIDSMFVENATATVGAGSSGNLDSQLDGFDCWYLFDNDKAGRKNAYKRVMEGKPVFCWNKFRFDFNLPDDIKDINDVVRYLKRGKFSFDELRRYFTRYVDQFKRLEFTDEKDIPVFHEKDEPEADEPDSEFEN